MLLLPCGWSVWPIQCLGADEHYTRWLARTVMNALKDHAAAARRGRYTEVAAVTFRRAVLMSGVLCDVCLLLLPRVLLRLLPWLLLLCAALTRLLGVMQRRTRPVPLVACTDVGGALPQASGACCCAG